MISLEPQARRLNSLALTGLTPFFSLSRSQNGRRHQSRFGRSGTSFGIHPGPRGFSDRGAIRISVARHWCLNCSSVVNPTIPNSVTHTGTGDCCRLPVGESDHPMLCDPHSECCPLKGCRSLMSLAIPDSVTWYCCFSLLQLLQPYPLDPIKDGFLFHEETTERTWCLPHIL